MGRKKRTPVFIEEAKNLGSSQRKVLETIENNHEGMTFSAIFEIINLIPSYMGTMMDIYVDMHLALEGKKEFLSGEEIFENIRHMLDDLEGHLIKDDAENEFNGQSAFFEKIHNVRYDIKRFGTYIKLQNINTLRNKLEEMKVILGEDSKPEIVYMELIVIASQAAKIAENIESYRQQVRNTRVAGRGDSDEAEQRRALANNLRASLSRTLSSLKARGLVAELAYPEEAYWRDAPSRYVITKKGYESLQAVRSHRGSMLSNLKNFPALT